MALSLTANCTLNWIQKVENRLKTLSCSWERSICRFFFMLATLMYFRLLLSELENFAIFIVQTVYLLVERYISSFLRIFILQISQIELIGICNRLMNAKLLEKLSIIDAVLENFSTLPNKPSIFQK